MYNKGLVLLNDWTHFILESSTHPTRILLWVIVILIVLFLLSRTHNILEEKSVNQAIRISRGLVSSLLVFVIGPIVAFLILNAMALTHDLPLIHIDFILDWIWLTVSSFWWLIRCLFNSAELMGANEPYSVDATIRIVWILLPTSIIWLKMFDAWWSRILIIPVIAGILFTTLHMKSSPTFLTSDGWLSAHWSFSKSSIPNNVDPILQGLSVQRIIQLILPVSFLALFLFFGVVKKNKIRAITFLVLALGSLIIPYAFKEGFQNALKPSASRIELDSLSSLLMNHRYNHLDKIKIYDISNEIKAILDANPDLQLRDTLCVNYSNYFYDYCY